MVDNPAAKTVDSILSALKLNRRAFLGALTGGAVLALTDVRVLLAGGIDAKPIVVRTHHKDASILAEDGSLPAGCPIDGEITIDGLIVAAGGTMTFVY